MTPQRRNLANAMIAAAHDQNSPWKATAGNTICYTETLGTPDDFRGGTVKYDEPSYNRRVLITFAGDRPILRISRAPWVRREDTFPTLKRAHEIIADPAQVFRR